MAVSSPSSLFQIRKSSSQPFHIFSLLPNPTSILVDIVIHPTKHPSCISSTRMPGFRRAHKERPSSERDIETGLSSITLPTRNERDSIRYKGAGWHWQEEDRMERIRESIPPEVERPRVGNEVLVEDSTVTARRSEGEPRGEFRELGEVGLRGGEGPEIRMVRIFVEDRKRGMVLPIEVECDVNWFIPRKLVCDKCGCPGVGNGCLGAGAVVMHWELHTAVRVLAMKICKVVIVNEKNKKEGEGNGKGKKGEPVKVPKHEDSPWWWHVDVGLGMGGVLVGLGFFVGAERGGRV